MTPKQRRRFNKRIHQGKIVMAAREPLIVRFMRALHGARIGW